MAFCVTFFEGNENSSVVRKTGIDEEKPGMGVRVAPASGYTEGRWRKFTYKEIIGGTKHPQTLPG